MIAPPSKKLPTGSSGAPVAFTGSQLASSALRVPVSDRRYQNVGAHLALESQIRCYCPSWRAKAPIQPNAAVKQADKPISSPISPEQERHEE
jgi:hypothetical protein